jgi:hypothetical protein
LVCAYKPILINYLENPREFPILYRVHTTVSVGFGFGDERFELSYLNEPIVADKAVFDMLLENLARRRITYLNVNGRSSGRAINLPLISVSSGGLHQFLTENDILSVICLDHLVIADDVCASVGTIPQNLDLLVLMFDELDVQRFVYAIGANAWGPQKIILTSIKNSRQRGVGIDAIDDFSSVSTVTPLLKNDQLNELIIDGMPLCSLSTDFTLFKAEATLNKSLETLTLFGGLGNHLPDDFKLFFEGVAAAPKLHTLCLEIESDVLPHQACQMFADALKDCQNNTLQHIPRLSLGGDCISNEVWNQELAPILQFNREKKRFQENTNKNTHSERLARALEIAQNSDNHHLRYWLVRNHAGDLLDD